MLTLPKHNRYEYSIIGERNDYAWPGGKRLAFCLTTNIEVYAYRRGTGWDPAKKGEPQQQRNYSWRDYGNRVGIWRLFDLFEQLNLPAAHNINSLLYEYHPQICARIRKRGDEVVGHGRTNAERQGELWELDERRLIDDVTQEITRREGHPPTGWMGPAASESNVTPDLLKEAGYRYVMDWPADDQPFWLQTRAGPILSVPYPAELNDSAAIIHRDGTDYLTNTELLKFANASIAVDTLGQALATSTGSENFAFSQPSGHMTSGHTKVQNSAQGGGAAEVALAQVLTASSHPVEAALAAHDALGVPDAALAPATPPSHHDVLIV